MRVRGRRGGLLVGMVLVVAVPLVAACGGGGDDDDGGGGGGGGGRVDRNEFESPLTEFLGEADASNEQYAEQERRVEAAVADCMSAQGFEYTPMETDFTEIEEGPFDLPDKEFVEKYGFGMFTIDWEEEGLDYEDPNQERLDAMSEAERTAYETALWGEYNEETGEQTGPIGCQAEAWETEGGEVDDDEFSALFEEWDALYTRIDENDQVKAAAREWANCMADAGYPDAEDPTMVSELVQGRYDEMAPEVEEPEPSQDGEGTISIDEALPEDGFGLDPADLEDLRAYEIEVATADYECRAEYDQVYFDVQSEIEQDFIDENRDELERYRDSSAAGGVG